MNKKSPGIRCTKCGCRLDPGERCDCESNHDPVLAEKPLPKNRDGIIRHNQRMMRRAQMEFDFK